MGNDPAVWMQAVRQATKAAIDEMTGGWDDPFCRFVDGFLLPRRSTWMVQQALKAGNVRSSSEDGDWRARAASFASFR